MIRSQSLIGQPPPPPKMLKRSFVAAAKKQGVGGVNGGKRKCYQPFGNASGKTSTAAIIRIVRDYAGLVQCTMYNTPIRDVDLDFFTE